MFVCLLVHTHNTHTHTRRNSTVLLHMTTIRACDLRLLQAVSHGFDRTVEDELARGADASAIFENGDTPLIVATRHRHVRIAHILLENGACIHTVDRWGNSALSYSAAYNLPCVVAELCRLGARVNSINDRGYSPLVSASTLQDGEVIVRTLLESGANPNHCMYSPLAFAARKRHWKTLMMLLEAGCDPNDCHFDGKAPIMYVCQFGPIDAVRALFDHGAHTPECVTDSIEKFCRDQNFTRAVGVLCARRAWHVSVVRVYTVALMMKRAGQNGNESVFRALDPGGTMCTVVEKCIR